MKKTGILAVLGLFLLSACATTATQTQLIPSPSPVIDRVMGKGELRVGTAGGMPPLNMTTSDGEIIGLEPDIAELMAEAMGVDLKLVPMPFNELLPALDRGKVDMVMSSMTMLPERNLKVAFVGPYMVSGRSLLTRQETLASVRDGSEINSPNTRLVALKGSTSQLFVEKGLPKAQLVTTEGYEEAIEMVIQEEADALVADYQYCLFAILRYPGEGLISLTRPLTHEPLGIALPPDDPLLVNWVSNYLNTLDESGTLDKLKDRWFKDRRWLKRLP
jgi:polar amino acid transport system substrate-binding protein